MVVGVSRPERVALTVRPLPAVDHYWARAVRVGAAPARARRAATSCVRKMVICTIKPGRRSPGFSNSARIRTAVSATGWIWGSTKVILPRNRFFSIGSGSPRPAEIRGWISTICPSFTR